MPLHPDFGAIQRQQRELPTISVTQGRQFGLQPLDGDQALGFHRFSHSLEAGREGIDYQKGFMEGALGLIGEEYLEFRAFGIFSK